MADTPRKARRKSEIDHTTPKKSVTLRVRTPSLKALENVATDETPEDPPARRSARKKSPTKRYIGDFELETRKRSINRKENEENTSPETESDEEPITPDGEERQELFDDGMDIEGKQMFGFNTPKKRDGMALAAMNAPKTPKTPKVGMKTPDTKRKKANLEPKTPRHVRNKVKKEISRIVDDSSNSDFSADGSDFEPSSDTDESSSSETAEEPVDEEEPTNRRGRRSVIVPVLPKTPSTSKLRAARSKKAAEYIPESDGYFASHHSNKILTSDHTLDRLKNPRLPADQLFGLLANMKLSEEHEKAIAANIEEYKMYFNKWLYVLNEGYSVLLYGLGSKRSLLQSFHHEILAKQTVLVVNGFFPSLTVKDILDSITNEILDLTSAPANLHEIVNLIEEEFSLIPETHLFLIVHNIDGAMLRNVKAQEILSRLAKVPNIHLLTSIDHINTPLLWDQNKLSNFNFTWWDATTMLPYTEETAFENSLLVQNSGELALSSMRNVFQSLTTNARGIYMLIVKHQLKNKGNVNYQGMPFKDLYWGCREAFLVSSDLALRAQLTEFLDHKLVKSKRSVDGSEQLQIPIESGLLQQFLDEHQEK